MSTSSFKTSVIMKQKPSQNTERAPALSTTQIQEKKSQTKRRDDGLSRAVVNGARFKVLGSKDIEEHGVCHVNRRAQTQGIADATPLDQRMGNTKYQFLCPTCGKDAENCEGHYGILALVTGGAQHYIYSSPFKEFIPNIMRSICFHCGEILLNDDMFIKGGYNRHKGEARIKEIADNVSGSACPYCGTASVKINSKKFDSENILAVNNDKNPNNKNPTTFSEADVYNLFNKITPRALQRLGFSINNKPSSFILTKLLVMPIVSRPSYFSNGGSSQLDQVSKKYNDILNAVNNDPPSAISKKQYIYDTISDFFENKDKNKTKVNRGTFWIKGTIDGKNGIVRKHMMGKRKNFTLRTVLAPGLGLRFGEIGLPERCKEFLFVKETVTANTYEYYRELFGTQFANCQISHIKYHSGNRQGTTCKVNASSWKRHRDSFGPGDEVDRQIHDGDIVLFNRQPTLGADSMMGYTAKYHDSLVIRLHLAVTTAHNADFDGDEGNAHQIQTIGSRLELASFAHVTGRIISENTNAPAFGVVFNGPSTADMLSRDNVMLSEEIWEQGYNACEMPQGQFDTDTFEDFKNRLEMHNIDLLSGKGLISALFPRDFYYQKGKDQNHVIIKNGILTQGILSKDHVGRVSNSIIQSMFNQYGQGRTADFITQIYFLLDWYIGIRGLTVSYADCSLLKEDYEKMSVYREEVLDNIQRQINNINGEFVDPNNFEKRFIEEQSKAYLQSSRDSMANYSKESTETGNPMQTMIGSGAKGNETNMTQIRYIVGQQLVGGRRPQRTLSYGKRCLPYFAMNSNDIYANGFCKHSFAEGLSPSELFFHAQASRIGLMDTGIRVSETGSIQRRMMKVMEDTYISANGSIVNTSGSEFSATSFDGFNPTKMTNVTGPLSGTVTTFINLKETIAKLNQEN